MIFVEATLLGLRGACHDLRAAERVAETKTNAE